jgi:hypothetical protein
MGTRSNVRTWRAASRLGGFVAGTFYRCTWLLLEWGNEMFLELLLELELGVPTGSGRRQRT